MRAHAIIGANYGDEGKGLMTDYICFREGADVVVRFNGGAQAGHTVVTPEGKRHVFHHFGSGSFLHVPTFLSEYFIVNPIQFAKEGQEIQYAKVYVHPDAVVTLPSDMLINQAWEKKLGKFASCGIGIHETMRRSERPEFRLTVRDIFDHGIYHRIMRQYVPFRIAELGIDLAVEPFWEEVYFNHAEQFMSQVTISTRPPGTRIVFEGAQGLMLDQNSPDFPWVTHSNTGIKNVLEICRAWRISDILATYVTRTYLTRHGAGPLPGEQPLPEFVKDHTNIDHPFQGPLRYAPLDVSAMQRRIRRDSERSGILLNLALTCCDQTNPASSNFERLVGYVSFGPTREDVSLLSTIREVA